MTDPIGYGIDVSHHNRPDWEAIRGHVDFVIVRANYGTRLDERAKEHVAHARDIGAKVGLYSFFRNDQPIEDQFRALETMSFDCGIGSGDIVPALDIEDDSTRKVHPDPSWSAPCEKFVEKAMHAFGECMPYITQRGWRMLGAPEWVLHRPLWCPNYRVAKPATPGNMPATIWQHRVDLFEEDGPSTAPEPEPTGALDQNRLLLPLPLVGYRPSSDDEARVRALVAENLRRSVQDPDWRDTDPSDLAPESEERNA